MRCPQCKGPMHQGRKTPQFQTFVCGSCQAYLRDHPAARRRLGFNGTVVLGPWVRVRKQEVA